ncbi:hypothetical protein TB2_043630 [Malus domestica]
MSEITGNSGESATVETTPNRVVELNEFSFTMDSVISVIVPRPKKSRTKAEKGAEEEVLAIQGFKFVVDDIVKFDVHVNDDEDTIPSSFSPGLKRVERRRPLRVGSCLISRSRDLKSRAEQIPSSLKLKYWVKSDSGSLQQAFFFFKF